MTLTLFYSKMQSFEKIKLAFTSRKASLFQFAFHKINEFVHDRVPRIALVVIRKIWLHSRSGKSIKLEPLFGGGEEYMKINFFFFFFKMSLKIWKMGETYGIFLNGFAKFGRDELAPIIQINVSVFHYDFPR